MSSKRIADRLGLLRGGRSHRFQSECAAFSSRPCARAYLDLVYELEGRNLLLVLGEYIWNREVIPPAEQWRTGADNCRRLAERAESLGVEIALELEPFPLSLLNNVDRMVQFIDAVGHPAVRGKYRRLAPAFGACCA